MPNIIIVESPTKARTLERFLGSGWTIAASMGHIRDLPKSTLGVDVENNFTPEYVISPDKKKNITQLKALVKPLVKKRGKIFLATDPDREGEAIAWHLLTVLGVPPNMAQRIVFHEITKEAIDEAVKHPREINQHLVDAQQARRVLDRLVGYKLSPLLWRKVRRGLSAGRVQSVTLRLVVDREREREAFQAVEYWSIDAEFGHETTRFSAQLARIDGKKADISSKEQSDEILKNLHGKQYIVANVQKKEVLRRPYPPFTTSTLQQDANHTLGFSAKKTMAVAQRLYEEGHITYMRTDSFHLAPGAVASARDEIQRRFGDRYLPPSPRFYKTTSKLAQEAHEAIRPTDIRIGGDEMQGKVDRDASRLYGQIWKRMLACQTADAVVSQDAIDIDAGTYCFRANGLMIRFDGWLAIMGVDTSKERILPDISIGESVELVHIAGAQHFTEPPPRYSEATLIKMLEELGIGRPSTYAPILSTIQERQYVERLEGRLVPTSLGIAVSDFLVKHFPHVVDNNFTAKLEDQFDAIAQGHATWVPVIRTFYGPFEKHIEEVTENAKRVKIEAEATGEDCPECQKPLVFRIGRFGRFIACSTFPKCRYTKPFVVKTNIPCPECKEGEVIQRRTRKKKVFYGCSRYPACKFASWKKPKVLSEIEGPIHGIKDGMLNGVKP
ncbi:MAG: type I DNA topoisomerase [bacterium]|nr:type I DNA topoisomerase [bacterium]